MARQADQIETAARDVFFWVNRAAKCWQGETIPEEVFRKAIREKVGGAGLPDMQIRALAAFYCLQEAEKELKKIRPDLVELRGYVGFIAKEFPEIVEDSEIYWNPIKGKEE